MTYQHKVKLEDIGDFYHFNCGACYRNCTLRVRNTSGNPPGCPYGLPCHDWRDVPGNIPAIDFYSTKGEL